MRTLPLARFSMALVAMLGVAVVAAPAAEGPLRAGAAALDVTPFLGDPIVGNFTTPPADYVHDPLHARALVLDDGATKLAFVIVDSVGVSRGVFDAARRLIAEKTDIPPGNVLAAATHTHSATSGRSKDPFGVDDPPTEYQQFLARRIADAVRLAAGNLAPAEVGWGSVDAPEHLFNRRWLLKPGETVPSPFGGQELALMNPGGNPKIDRPAGPTDPQVSFLAVRTPEGRPVALLANYSLHYVGGVPSGHVSADYFGIFARKVGELLGADPLHDPPFVGFMTNGTSGDVNNIDFKGTPPAKPYAPYEKMTIVAHDLADRVAKAYEGVEFRSKLKLGAASRELVLKCRRPTPEQVAYARAVLAKPEDAPKHHGLERIFAERTLGLMDAPEEAPVLLQAFRIGDLGVAAIPFEVFTETGLEIKERSPFASTFTIELANGSHGYLPTPRHFDLGGYETWLGVNRVEPQASGKIVATILDLFSSLKE
jgi:neutral ceramidase